MQRKAQLMLPREQLHGPDKKSNKLHVFSLEDLRHLTSYDILKYLRYLENIMARDGRSHRIDAAGVINRHAVRALVRERSTNATKVASTSIVNSCSFNVVRRVPGKEDESAVVFDLDGDMLLEKVKSKREKLNETQAAAAAAAEAATEVVVELGGGDHGFDLYEWNDQRVYIQSIRERSQADKAGLKVGMELVKIGDQEIGPRPRLGMQGIGKMQKGRSRRLTFKRGYSNDTVEDRLHLSADIIYNMLLNCTPGLIEISLSEIAIKLGISEEAQINIDRNPELIARMILEKSSHPAFAEVITNAFSQIEGTFKVMFQYERDMGYGKGITYYEHTDFRDKTNAKNAIYIKTASMSGTPVSPLMKGRLVEINGVNVDGKLYKELLRLSRKEIQDAWNTFGKDHPDKNMVLRLSSGMMALFHQFNNYLQGFRSVGLGLESARAEALEAALEAARSQLNNKSYFPLVLTLERTPAGPLLQHPQGRRRPQEPAEGPPQRRRRRRRPQVTPALPAAAADIEAEAGLAAGLAAVPQEPPASAAVDIAEAAPGLLAAPTTDIDPISGQPEPSVGLAEAAETPASTAWDAPASTAWAAAAPAAPAAPAATMSAKAIQRKKNLDVFPMSGGSSKINKKYIRSNKKGRKTFNINKKRTKNKRVNDR